PDQPARSRVEGHNYLGQRKIDRENITAGQLRLLTGPHSLGCFRHVDLPVSTFPEESVWPGLGTDAPGGEACPAAVFPTSDCVACGVGGVDGTVPFPFPLGWNPNAQRNHAGAPARTRVVCVVRAGCDQQVPAIRPLPRWGGVRDEVPQYWNLGR